MGEEEQPLLPGLPDDIALDCIAKIPQRFCPFLRPVCRRWRDLLTSSSFRRHRERIGTAEDLIFLVQALVDAGGFLSSSATGDSKGQNKPSSVDLRPPVYALSMYSTSDGSWHRLSSPEPVPMFAQCTVVDEKLVLIGGWNPTTLDPVADVRILDLTTGEWRKGAPMSTARSFFACARVGGRIYVAGGHDGMKNALRTAEMYDLAADVWEEIPAMADERDECRGVAVGGKFWAVSGYRTETQGRFDTAGECYDPASGQWVKVEGVWSEEGGTASFFACEGCDVLCCVDRRGVREYRAAKGWWELAPAPAGMKGSACATAIRGGGEVFVTGLLAASGDGDGGEGFGAWFVELESGRWRRVQTTVGFSGFAFSAGLARM
ncbi:hypothetical protein HPP92_007589 [Vanilla planifolia]|uniref:F-box/kelch-repeat protein n=1 Tax=Vanilla planifolia TaxID=51239 RepID=A0A835RM90_VANPL|nr:hypothetical protein HPP92_007589 [Vanilla planifolia]